MRLRAERHIDGQSVSPHKPAGRIQQQGVGGTAVVEIDRWEQVPGARTMRTGDDRLAVSAGILEPKLPDGSDIGRPRRTVGGHAWLPAQAIISGRRLNKSSGIVLVPLVCAHDGGQNRYSTP